MAKTPPGPDRDGRGPMLPLLPFGAMEGGFTMIPRDLLRAIGDYFGNKPLLVLLIHELSTSNHRGHKQGDPWPAPDPVRLNLSRIAREFGRERTRLTKAMAALLKCDLVLEPKPGSYVLNMELLRWRQENGQPAFGDVKIRAIRQTGLFLRPVAQAPQGCGTSATVGVAQAPQVCGTSATGCSGTSATVGVAQAPQAQYRGTRASGEPEESRTESVCGEGGEAPPETHTHFQTLMGEEEHEPDAEVLDRACSLAEAQCPGCGVRAWVQANARRWSSFWIAKAVRRVLGRDQEPTGPLLEAILGDWTRLGRPEAGPEDGPRRNGHGAVASNRVSAAAERARRWREEWDRLGERLKAKAVEGG